MSEEDFESYITNDQISALIFDDEEVPGPNTVSRSRNNEIKSEVKDTLHQAMCLASSAPLVTDTYNVFKKIAKKLYNLGLKEKPMELDDEDWRNLRRYEYVGVPIVQMNQRTKQIVQSD